MPQVVDNKTSEIMRVVYGPNYRPAEVKPAFTAPSSTFISPAPNTPPRGGIQQGQLNNTPTRGVSVDRVSNNSIIQQNYPNNSVRIIDQQNQSPAKRSSSVTYSREPASPGFTLVGPSQPFQNPPPQPNPPTSSFISRPSYSSAMSKPSVTTYTPPQPQYTTVSNMPS